VALDAQEMEVLMSADKKILVIQTAFPGDAILTLPLIQELKRKKTGYSIEVLCIPQTAEIFNASTSVNSVIPFDKKGRHKSLFAFIGLIKELKQKKYDLVYSPHRSLRSALIAMNIGAIETYGFENSSLKFAFTHTVGYDPSVHEVKRNLEFTGDDYSGDKWRIIPEITVSDENREKVKMFLVENKFSRFIAIAPGSVWETKKYPAEYFREVLDYFVGEKYKIVLIGGFEDRLLCEELAQNHSEDLLVAAGDISFTGTIELLKNASLLICNDSAPAHLGVCANIPVLTIYCSTTPLFGFYPYNKLSDYISYDDLFCKPCGIHGYKACPLGHFDCAKLLRPDLVIEKARKLLSNAG
jgi:heptosyltransferase-2